MFRLGKQVESGLMALKALHESGQEGLSISGICRKHHFSKNTLAKIMQGLQNGEILKSSQGSRGGYTLAKPLEAISFYDFLEALGEIKPLQCRRQEAPCQIQETCTISSPLLKWERSLENHLKSTSVQDLLYDAQLKEVAL